MSDMQIFHLFLCTRQKPDNPHTTTKKSLKTSETFSRHGRKINFKITTFAYNFL